MQNQMLRRILIRELHRLLHRRRLHYNRLRNGLTHDIETGKSTRLGIDFVFDGGEGGRWERDGDEDYLGVNAVFGLREEVGGNERGVAGVVGDDLCIHKGIRSEIQNR